MLLKICCNYVTYFKLQKKAFKMNFILINTNTIINKIKFGNVF